MAHHRVIRNITSNYALVATSGLITLVLTPILFRYLQPVNFAILAFAITASTLLAILDLGMASALIRFVSDLAARGQIAELRRLVSTVFFLFLAVGVAASILVATLSGLVASFFHLQSASSGSAFLVISLVGSSVAFQLPSASVRGLLEGLEDFHLANAADIASQLARAFATLLFVYGGLGLLPIAALFPAAALLRLAGLLFVTRWTSVPTWPSLGEANWATLRRIRGFASLTFIEDTATALFSQSDTFLVAKLLPLSDLAVLVVARRFPWAVSRLAQQALWVAYPIVSSAAARGDLAAMKKFMLISTRNLLSLALPIAGALFVWAGVILRLWVGKEVLSGIPVFRAFLVFAVTASLQESPLTLLYGMGRIRFSAGLSVVTLAGAVGLGALACSRGGLPALAVVYASIQGIVTPLLCSQALRLADLEPAQWLRKAVVPPVLAEVPTVAWFLLSYRLLPHTAYGLAISTVPGILLFFGLLQRLVSGSERQPWRTRIKKLFAE